MNGIKIHCMYFFCFLAALGTVEGCKNERNAFQRGMDAWNRDELKLAEQSFQTAIDHGEHVWESHYQLGRLYDANDDRRLLALWHFRQGQALQPADVSEEERKDIQAAIDRCEARVMDELSTRRSADELKALRLKIRLLEEYEKNRSKWLEELERENTELRRELTELRNNTR